MTTRHILRDAQRNPVPPRLREVFLGRRYLARLAYRIRLVQRELERHQNDVAFAALDVPAVCALLGRAWQTIERDKPCVPCECAPREECPDCQNRQWLTELEYFQRKSRELLPS